MENLKHGGGSSLLDAAYQACAGNLVSDTYQGVGEPRKILVIVGDGHDNASKHTLDEVIHAARRNHVTIYAVSTEAWGFEVAEESNLVKMVRATGGRITRPLQNVHKDTAGFLSKPQDAGNYALTVGTGLYTQAQLQALYAAILDIHGNVQSQYILGYAPPTPFSDGSLREVKVRLKIESNADVQLYYRPSYLPPPLPQQ
jgi:hypothetical protein